MQEHVHDAQPIQRLCVKVNCARNPSMARRPEAVPPCPKSHRRQENRMDRMAESSGTEGQRGGGAEEQGGNARRSTTSCGGEGNQLHEISNFKKFEISDSPVHMISLLPFCAPLLLRSSAQGIIAKTDTMDVLVLADD